MRRTCWRHFGVALRTDDSLPETAETSTVRLRNGMKHNAFSLALGKIWVTYLLAKVIDPSGLWMDLLLALQRL